MSAAFLQLNQVTIALLLKGVHYRERMLTPVTYRILDVCHTNIVLCKPRYNTSTGCYTDISEQKRAASYCTQQVLQADRQAT